MKSVSKFVFVAIGLVLVLTPAAVADTFGSGANQFDIDFVTISGDTNPTSGIPAGSGFTFTGVDNDFRMGVYEITNDQWNKFEASLGVPVTGYPSIAYDSAPTSTGANVPTNGVSWYEAAQFVNYLNTSTGHQPAYRFMGTQGSGYYMLSTWGTAEADGGTNRFRHKDAMYYLPTENEWVKAAYWNGTELQTHATKLDDSPHQGDGVSGTGWNYYDNGYASNSVGPWAVGSGSEELNGTYDMMGNVWEKLESPSSEPVYRTTSNRGLRGGSYYLNASQTNNLTYSDRGYTNPKNENFSAGFRVASEYIEPDILSLLLDIRPGSDENPVNSKSNGALPVAIYGTGDIDVTEIDLATLMLEGMSLREKGKSGKLGSFEDINGDSILDLVLHFDLSELPFDASTDAYTLSGMMLDGMALEGSDSIRAVPHGNAFAGPQTLAASWGNEPLTADIPEPASLALLAIGGLAMLRRRK